MRFKKALAFFVLAVMLVSVFAGCSSGQAPEKGKEDGEDKGEKLVLRLANSHNAEHITSQACQMFADLVKDRSEGRIEIETHFAGELGDERSTIEQAQFGGLDFTRVSSGASAEFSSLMDALQMPYLYNDVDHLFKVLDGEIGQDVFNTFEDNKLVGITYIHPGSRNFFNSKREVRKPEDLKGLKIRVSESELMLALMEALGSNGVGIPFTENYSAIQTGVVDGAENNMTSYIEMSFYEVAKYWTYDGHSYMPDMILASKETMDKLSAEDQEMIKKAAHEASLWHREKWEESEALNAEIAKEKGSTLTTLTPEELQLFKDAVAPLYDEFLDEAQKEIVKRVQELE